MKVHFALAILSVFVLSACEDEPTEPQSSPYLPQTSPENVIENLETSWRMKDADAYAKLLRHDYLFQFLEEDAQEIGQEFWNRDEDSTAVARLFSAGDINGIRFELLHSGSIDSTGAGLPDGTKNIRAIAALEVDQAPDITLVVSGDTQSFFFLKGDPAHGEDPDLWYILQWRDRGDLSEFGRPEVAPITVGLIKALHSAPGKAETEDSTLGRIKASYR